MAENNIPSEEVFPGFPKIPYVSLPRMNVIPFLTNIKVKYDKNGKMIPFSLNEGKSCILKNILRDCSVVLRDIRPNNITRISKKNTRKNKNLKVTKINKKQRGKPKTMKKNVTSSKREMKMKQKQFKCKRCNKFFKENKSLKEHMKIKHTKQIYICRHCSKKYVRRFFFEKHIGLHCEKCFTLQRNQMQYMEHITSCENDQNIEQNDSTSQNYDCDLCSDQFPSICGLKYHRAVTHSDNRPKEYYTIHSFGSSKRYTCNFCKQCYEDKNIFESHISILHEISPPITNNLHSRDDTNSIANNMEEPQAQIRSNNPVTLENVKEEEMACTTLEDMCENASVDLKGPQLKNDRILRYNCKICDKIFLTNFALIRHTKLHHMLDTLSCKLCKEAFTVFSSLQSHKCIGKPTEYISVKPENDAECNAPLIPPAESEESNLRLESNTKTCQKDLVYNIVVREVPIEF